VQLGARVSLRSHVVVDGHTTIGEGTEIFPFASIGTPPQDLKYSGEASELVIGRNNKIREYVTMNPGTEGGGMLTKVGDGCLFMISAHVAHDCQVGNGVIMANNATLAGHVVVGDHAIIGGLSAVHQFVRIGHQAMIGGMSGVEQDVIPFGSVMGDRASLHGLNIIGLKRRGFEKDEIHALRAAYKALFAPDSGTMGERVEAVATDYAGVDAVGELISFIRASGSSRGVLQPRGADHGG
jgi:UDP-N-acetylglucosamine acyltransferase